MGNDQEKIEEAAHWVKNARALLITAGAGMGVDSGLPDFRGPDGFWRAYPALGAARMHFQDIAAPHAFRIHPALAWGFYGHRLALYRRTPPHTGFEFLHRWAEAMPEGYRVFTSNVDGHFQGAGFAPEKVHECHGSIHMLQCLEPCCEEIWSAEEFKPEIDAINCLLLNAPPKCPHCGGMARPNILMFDDYSWVDPPTAESRSRLDAWIGARDGILVIEVGAGTEIPTARRFGERQAKQLIRINARQAGVRGGKRNMGLMGTALDTLSAIDEVVRRL